MLLIMSAYLYGGHLDDVPLQPDEVQLSGAASTLATTGWHDSRGRLLPVLVQVSGNTWLTPIPVYAIATLMRIFDSAYLARWAAGVTGAVDVLLVYVVALTAFESTVLAFVAGVMMLLSPAHTEFSRLALPDGVWQVPFVEVWLIALMAFVHERFLPARWMLAIGVASLAASIYSQPSAAIMIPWFGLLTLAAIYHARRFHWREIAPACGALAAVLLPLALWFARYPVTYFDTFGIWSLHQAYIRNPLDWARAWSNIQSLSVSGDVFWDFFRPSHLFLQAGADAAPVFSLLTGSLLVFGAYDIVRRWKAEDGLANGFIRKVCLLGFFIGPLATSTFKQYRAVQRTLVVVPFGVLLATFGVWALWTRCRPWIETRWR
jgi:hypothetical protein